MGRTVYVAACEECGEPYSIDSRNHDRQRFCGLKCSGKARARATHTRFWERVQLGARDECWPWQGALVGHVPFRYGQLRRAAVEGGGRVKAHRYAWEITVAPVPPGLHVLHSCDNPPCVNPSHLFLGTHADNMVDMARKGRVGGACAR